MKEMSNLSTTQPFMERIFDRFIEGKATGSWVHPAQRIRFSWDAITIDDWDMDQFIDHEILPAIYKVFAPDSTISKMKCWWESDADRLYLIVIEKQVLPGDIDRKSSHDR